MEEAETESDYLSVAKAFDVLKDYSDASEKAQEARKMAAEVRARAEAEKQAKMDSLECERTTLRTELANLKGLFTGKRRREIEARLAELEAELKKLQ